jgi:hypothetical protein
VGKIKSFAKVVVAALLIGLISDLPAQAQNRLTITASSSTVIEGTRSEFRLGGSVSDSAFYSFNDLKFEVSNLTRNNQQFSTVTESKAGTSCSNPVYLSGTIQTCEREHNSNRAVVSASTNSLTSAKLRLTATGPDVVVLQVRAWVDANKNNVRDPYEPSTPASQLTVYPVSMLKSFYEFEFEPPRIGGHEMTAWLKSNDFAPAAFNEGLIDPTLLEININAYENRSLYSGSGYRLANTDQYFITVLGPRYLEPGTTNQISLQVFNTSGAALNTSGSALEVNAYYNGPGIFASTLLGLETDSSGFLNLPQLALGTNDSGSGTLVVEVEDSTSGTVLASVTRSYLIESTTQMSYRYHPQLQRYELTMGTTLGGGGRYLATLSYRVSDERKVQIASREFNYTTQKAPESETSINTGVGLVQDPGLVEVKGKFRQRTYTASLGVNTIRYQATITDSRGTPLANRPVWLFVDLKDVVGANQISLDGKKVESAFTDQVVLERRTDQNGQVSLRIQNSGTADGEAIGIDIQYNGLRNTQLGEKVYEELIVWSENQIRTLEAEPLIIISDQELEARVSVLNGDGARVIGEDVIFGATWPLLLSDTVDNSLGRTRIKLSDRVDGQGQSKVTAQVAQRNGTVREVSWLVNWNSRGPEFLAPSEYSQSKSDLVQFEMPDSIDAGIHTRLLLNFIDETGRPADIASPNEFLIDYQGPGQISQTRVIPNPDGSLVIDLGTETSDEGIGTITIDYQGETYIRKFSIGDFGAFDSQTFSQVSAWTTRLSDSQVKVYVKYPTVGEKLRISHQTGGEGEYQTIFVKTIDSEVDSALVVNDMGTYVVRTIDLESGTNRIRVTVGDETLVQVRYNN